MTGVTIIDRYFYDTRFPSSLNRLRNVWHHRLFRTVYDYAFKQKTSNRIQDVVIRNLRSLAVIPALVMRCLVDRVCTCLYPPRTYHVKQFDFIICKDLPCKATHAASRKESHITSFKILFDGQDPSENYGVPFQLVVDQLNIFLETEGTRQELLLPKDVRANLLKFFASVYKNDSPPYFCCYDFVDWIFDRFQYYHFPEETGEKTILDRWETKPLTGIPEPGRAICCIDAFGTPMHAALHIGCGYYMSIYGNDSPLGIATLEQMHNCYETTSAVELVKPRPRSADIFAYSILGIGYAIIVKKPENAQQPIHHV